MILFYFMLFCFTLLARSSFLVFITLFPPTARKSITMMTLCCALQSALSGRDRIERKILQESLLPTYE